MILPAPSYHKINRQSLYFTYVIYTLQNDSNNTKVLVKIINFPFSIIQGYLLSGYVYYASGEYDVNWTTPQCILCLRLLSMFLVIMVIICLHKKIKEEGCLLFNVDQFDCFFLLFQIGN